MADQVHGCNINQQQRGATEQHHNPYAASNLERTRDNCNGLFD